MTHIPGGNRKGTVWTSKEVSRLRELVKGNTPTPLIANILGRTTPAVEAKAQDKSISLKPTNKSPYNRRK